jgi:ankyrin repeat protein
VQLAIGNGADVNLQVPYFYDESRVQGWKSEPILLNSIKSNDEEPIKLLVENGANIDNYIGLASENGQLEIVKYLHQNGADVNDGIEWASRSEHLDVVKYLHQNGADINKAIEVANPNFKEQLVDYKTSMEEKALLQNDLKEVKQEQQKPKNTMRI